MHKLGNNSLSLGLVAVLLTCSVACTVDQVLADIDLIIQMTASITTAVGPVSPADAAALQKITTIASTGLSAVQAAYDTYKASGSTTDLAKLQAAIAAVQQNLSQELAALHISDPAAVQKVTAWVNLVSVTLTAILGILPGLNGAKISRAAQDAVPTTKYLKSQWKNAVCGGAKTCTALVH